MPYADPKKNKEYQLKYQAEYRKTHREKMRAQTKAWAKADPERAHRASYNSYLKHSYGITLVQYEELLAKQDFKCACCGLPQEKHIYDPKCDRARRLFVDHNHLTGHVRGLICYSCNVGLGHLGDSLEGVLKAVAYLERGPAIFVGAGP